MRVSIGDRTLTFDVAANAPDATAILARLTRAYRASRTIIFDETLASSPTNATTTRFTVVAPNRLSYQNARRRGRDRDRRTPLGPGDEQGAVATDVADATRRHAALLDDSPRTRISSAPTRSRSSTGGSPAGSGSRFDGSRPTVQHMTAAAHFMTDRYVGFDVPADVSPPSR